MVTFTSPPSPVQKFLHPPMHSIVCVYLHLKAYDHVIRFYDKVDLGRLLTSYKLCSYRHVSEGTSTIRDGKFLRKQNPLYFKEQTLLSSSQWMQKKKEETTVRNLHFSSSSAMNANLPVFRSIVESLLSVPGPLLVNCSMMILFFSSLLVTGSCARWAAFFPIIFSCINSSITSSGSR